MKDLFKKIKSNIRHFYHKHHQTKLPHSVYVVMTFTIISNIIVTFIIIKYLIP